MRSRRSLLVVAGFAVALLAACSTVSVSSIRYVGVPVAAPTAPGAVEVLRREPRRPHEKLGEIVLRPSGNPSLEQLEAALRREGAKLGADAVVVVRDTTRRVGTFVSGPWWARSASPVYGRVVIAVAVRYR